MNIEEFKESAEMLRAVAHPVRLALVKSMIEKGPLNVTTLYEEFGMPQSTISQHLAKLKAVNVVSGTRKGLEIYYEVKDKRVENILDAIVSA